MFQAIEQELEDQFTDLLSIVNDGPLIHTDEQPKSICSTKSDLDAINSQLNEELNEKLQSIEQAKEELDEELKKRDSLIIEFDKLDQTGYFSSESSTLLDYLDTTDSLFQKNNCETIEEKDENASEDEVDLNGLNYFNHSRTNLNSVLEEDENEESQNDDLIDLNNLNDLNDFNDELKELDNNINGHDTLPCKRNSTTNENSMTSSNLQLNPQSNLSSNVKSNLSSNVKSNVSDISSNFSNTDQTSTTNTLTMNSTQSISSSTTTSAIPISRNDSVLDLVNLNSESNILVNNIVKKGILQVWQQQKFNKGLTTSCSTNSLKSNAKRFTSIFSIGTVKLRNWKSRYFMLTENYLLCFKKGNKSDFLSKMGKFQFKLNLLDDIRSIAMTESNTHGKSYCIDLNDGMMFLFDKDRSLLQEWYNSLMKIKQKCEMIRQDQEIKFRKERQGIAKKEIKEIKEILSERIERRKLVVSSGGEMRRESLLDKFSEKYLDKSLHNSSSKLASEKSDDAFEYLNNLKQRLSGATSVNELNRSSSSLAQVKTNTPIINNRKRMSLQRKSLLSQFDSFLGSPLSHSSSKQQIQQQDNILANLANLTGSNWDNQKLIIESIESPTMLPRLAPQCVGNTPTNQLNNGQLNKQNNKQLTNSCSVFQLGNNNVHSPFTINNSPALTQRSLYAERILSNSSLTLSNLSSRLPNSRHSTLSQSIFKPFRESIHYATSLRKDAAPESKSHLKSATSEFSFIRLTNSSNTSTLTKETDDHTLKRNNRNAVQFNRTPSLANECSDNVDSEQELSTSTTDYNCDTLRNELRNSKTITNLNSELSNRTHILNPNDIGLGHLNMNNNLNNDKNEHLLNGHLNSNLNSSQNNNNNNNNNSNLSRNSNVMNAHLMNNHQINHHHKYQKLKKINNSLDDSTFSSSNSSSCSSSNYHSVNSQRQSARLELDNLKHNRQLHYSPQLNHSTKLIDSSNHSMNSQQQRNNKKISRKETFITSDQFKNEQTDHTYQKVNSKRCTNKQSNKTSNSKLNNGSRSQAKKKASSIPVSNCNHRTFTLNEPIYQSTEKRKNRMNKILENQSKIYVTMSDLK